MDYRNSNSDSKVVSVIDATVIQLQKRFREDKELAFKELLYACISHKESHDYYKLKEVFLAFIEKLRELPQLDDQQGDMINEIFLSITSKYPSPLASKGFSQFARLMINKEKLQNNQILKKRFTYSKNNILKLGISTYFGDSDLEKVAISLTLFFLQNFENAHIHNFTQVPEYMEMINQTEKRMMQQQIKYLMDLSTDNRELFNKGITELKIHSDKMNEGLDKMYDNLKEVERKNADLENHQRILEPIIKRIDAHENQIESIKEKNTKLGEGADRYLEYFVNIEKGMKSQYENFEQLSQRTKRIEENVAEALKNIKETYATEKNLSIYADELNKKFYELQTSTDRALDQVIKSISLTEMNSIKDASEKNRRDNERIQSEFYVFKKEFEVRMKEYSKTAEPVKLDAERKLKEMQNNQENTNYRRLNEKIQELESKLNTDSNYEIIEMINDLKRKADSNAKSIERLSHEVSETFNKQQYKQKKKFKTIRNNRNVKFDDHDGKKSMREWQDELDKDKSKVMYSKISEDVANLKNQVRDLLERRPQFNDFDYDQKNKISPELESKFRQLEETQLILSDRLNSNFSKYDNNIREIRNQLLQIDEQSFSKNLNDYTKQNQGKSTNSDLEHKILEYTRKEIDMKFYEYKQGNYNLKENIETQLKIMNMHVEKLADKMNNDMNPQITEISKKANQFQYELERLRMNSKEDSTLLKGLNKKSQQLSLGVQMLAKHAGIYIDMDRVDISNFDPEYSTAEKSSGTKSRTSFNQDTGMERKYADRFTSYEQRLNQLEDKINYTSDKEDIKRKPRTPWEMNSNLEDYCDSAKNIDDIAHICKSIIKSSSKEFARITEAMNNNSQGQTKFNKYIVESLENMEKSLASGGASSDGIYNKELNFQLANMQVELESLKSKFKNDIDQERKFAQHNFDAIIKELKSRNRGGDEDNSVQIINAQIIKLQNEYQILESNTIDYLKNFVEPEALRKSNKINKNFVPIEEKYEALLFLIRNHKFISKDLIRESISSFRGGLSKLGPKYAKFKMESFEELLSIIKQYPDLTSDYLFYSFEVLFAMLTEEPKNVLRAYEIDLVKYLVSLVVRSETKDSIKAALLKICSYLCKLDEFLQAIYRKRLTQSIFDFCVPLIDTYNFDSDSSNDADYSTYLEDNITKDAYENDFAEINGMPTKMAVIYYAICLLWELLKKEKIFDETKPESIVKCLFRVLSKPRTVRPLRILTLHTLTRIGYYESESYRIMFANQDYVEVLIMNATDKKYPAEVQRLAGELLLMICSVYSIKKMVEGKIDLQKFSKGSKKAAILPPVKTINSLSEQKPKPREDSAKRTLPTIETKKASTKSFNRDSEGSDNDVKHYSKSKNMTITPNSVSSKVTPAKRRVVERGQTYEDSDPFEETKTGVVRNKSLTRNEEFAPIEPKNYSGHSPMVESRGGSHLPKFNYLESKSPFILGTESSDKDAYITPQKSYHEAPKEEKPVPPKREDPGKQYYGAQKEEKQMSRNATRNYNDFPIQKKDDPYYGQQDSYYSQKESSLRLLNEPQRDYRPPPKREDPGYQYYDNPNVDRQMPKDPSKQFSSIPQEEKPIQRKDNSTYQPYIPLQEQNQLPRKEDYARQYYDPSKDEKNLPRDPTRLPDGKQERALPQDDPQKKPYNPVSQQNYAPTREDTIANASSYNSAPNKINNFINPQSNQIQGNGQNLMGSNLNQGMSTDTQGLAKPLNNTMTPGYDPKNTGSITKPVPDQGFGGSNISGNQISQEPPKQVQNQPTNQQIPIPQVQPQQNTLDQPKPEIQPNNMSQGMTGNQNLTKLPLQNPQIQVPTEQALKQPISQTQPQVVDNQTQKQNKNPITQPEIPLNQNIQGGMNQTQTQQINSSNMSQQAGTQLPKTTENLPTQTLNQNPGGSTINTSNQQIGNSPTKLPQQTLDNQGGGMNQTQNQTQSQTQPKPQQQTQVQNPSQNQAQNQTQPQTSNLNQGQTSNPTQSNTQTQQDPQKSQNQPIKTDTTQNQPTQNKDNQDKVIPNQPIQNQPTGNSSTQNQGINPQPQGQSQMTGQQSQPLNQNLSNPQVQPTNQPTTQNQSLGQSPGGMQQSDQGMNQNKPILQQQQQQQPTTQQNTTTLQNSTNQNTSNQKPLQTSGNLGSSGKITNPNTRSIEQFNPKAPQTQKYDPFEKQQFGRTVTPNEESEMQMGGGSGSRFHRSIKNLRGSTTSVSPDKNMGGPQNYDPKKK